MRKKRVRKHAPFRRMASRPLILPSLCMIFTVLALDAVVHPTYSQYSHVTSIPGTLSAGAVFYSVYGIAPGVRQNCSGGYESPPRPEEDAATVVASVYEPLSFPDSSQVLCPNPTEWPYPAVTESVYADESDKHETLIFNP